MPHYKTKITSSLANTATDPEVLSSSGLLLSFNNNTISKPLSTLPSAFSTRPKSQEHDSTSSHRSPSLSLPPSSAPPLPAIDVKELPRILFTEFINASIGQNMKSLRGLGVSMTEDIYATVHLECELKVIETSKEFLSSVNLVIVDKTGGKRFSMDLQHSLQLA
ncbi:hypothetical protein BDA99DRAFT_564008 [Phascolomyces articulosus]|uniref:Uncharacterized protein n=1 Tax=Phascolomyces articulosus TaxID=60185 RepID=A0AAD5JR23_9FUNG|nr:hypothetical protein BDA99DRAFT_564008 [Phascolomyces articulosus]